MRQTRATELSTGLFVLLGFAALFFLTTQITNRGLSFGPSGYSLHAKFDNIGGLRVGAPVSMSGVKIGQVEEIGFDSVEYRAEVKLRIESQFDQIPNDTNASIFTAGLLGGQYIGLGAGGSETYFKEGDQIESTQSALVLESLISKFLFSFGDDNDKADEGEAKADAPAEDTAK
jgi:phospholipid/cholesterol/gamma-HCH transport system substrate-binding protein